MKPQRKTTSGVALLFLAQNLFFPLGVQGASKTVEVLGAVGGVVSQIPAMYSQQPSSPNFSGVNSALQSKMNACIAKNAIGLTGDSTKDAASIQSSVDKWKGILSKKNKTGTTDSKSDICKKVCTKPSKLNEEPSCSAMYGEPRKSDEYQNGIYEPSSDQLTKFNNAKTGIAEYLECLNDKQECPDPDQEALKKQVAAFNCQMAVLQTAVQESSQALQQSLQANQKTFGDMNQHQKEIGEQIQQVDEILGPDPELSKSGSSQFQGLLGLQKELNENLPKMTEAEAKFKTDTETLKNDTKTNEQNLEATRVNVASQCIKGSRNVGVSGGYSLTCFKPVKTTAKDGTAVDVLDRNGNVKYSKQSCGPYDYIRSKIEQKALVNARGEIMNRSQSRIEKASANALAFDSLVDSINRAMGDYDAKGADNARLDADVHSWSDIESKVSSNIDAVASQSGVDVRSMLRSVAGHCFQEADGWKNKQMRSSDSEYSKKKAEIKTRQTNLTSQMDTGLTSMNKTYSDVMSVLFNKHVTLNRAQCTKDNPELMQDCFAKVRQNVQNLLEGNGNLTMTAKTIKGGSSTQPFVVSCRGVNGCVTAFKNVRDSQKTYIRDVQKKKEAYVNQGNQQTQMQLTAFTGQLSTLQNSLLSQYDVMKTTMIKMGLDVPEKPKFMDSEALEPMEGQDKSPGPFKNPKSMAGVLSGMMQPSGMINFGDTGMRDVQKQLAEKIAAKKEKNADELKTYRDINRKYVDLNCPLKPGVGSDPSDRVGMMNDSCWDAKEKADSCAQALSNDSEKKSDYESNIETLKFISEVCSKMADDSNQSHSTEFQDLKKRNIRVLRSLSETKGCDGVILAAKKCKDDGKGVYTEDLLKKTGSAGSASDLTH